jgi:hypothetical protein
MPTADEETGSSEVKQCSTSGIGPCRPVLRIPHSLHTRLTDGANVVNLTHRPRSTPEKYYFPASGTHFC